MENELVDILNEDGNYTGKACLKSEAHKLGLFHPTVHVWFYTSQKEILLQKRGANKETFPNFWDVSVAGHVSAGESIEDAAIREAKEEIDVTISIVELKKLQIRKNVNVHPNGIKDCEFQHVFLVKLQTSFDKLNKQENEVDELRLFTLTEFKHSIEKPDSKYKIVPTSKAYYNLIMENVHQVQ